MSSSRVFWSPWFPMRYQSNLCEDPLSVMSFFSWSFQDFLFFFDFISVYDMSMCGSLWVYSTWSLLSFLNVLINIFIRFEKVWSLFLLIFFCLFLGSFSGALIMHMLIHLMVSNKSLRFCLFFFILFFFFLLLSLDSIYWLIFKFTDFFLLWAQICCWAPLVNIYFTYYTFQFQSFYF